MVFDSAVRSNDLIASLFPSNVRDRVIAAREPDKVKELKRKSRTQSSGFRSVDQESLLSDEDVDEDALLGTAPIADLFLETTIL